MVIYDNRGSEEIPIPMFKVDDFNKFIIALELIFLDFWHLFSQNIRTKCEKYVPELVEKLNIIVRIRTPIEDQVYKNDFSWKDINRYLLNKERLAFTLEESNFGIFIEGEEECWLGIDSFMLDVQLELINKLHDSEKVFIEDLAPLQEKKINSINNSFKDYLYDKLLFNLEYELINLSFEELKFIGLLIDKALEIKNDKELEDARNIIFGFFKAFYSHIDYIIG